MKTRIMSIGAAKSEADPGAKASESGILSGAGAQIKNQEPELSLKIWTGAGTMAILEIAPASGPSY